MAKRMDNTDNTLDKARVCMYVLNDSLDQTADEIKSFLRKECEIKYYYELEKPDYDTMSIKMASMEASRRKYFYAYGNSYVWLPYGYTTRISTHISAYGLPYGYTTHISAYGLPYGYTTHISAYGLAAIRVYYSYIRISRG